MFYRTTPKARSLYFDRLSSTMVAFVCYRLPPIPIPTMTLAELSQPVENPIQSEMFSPIPGIWEAHEMFEAACDAYAAWAERFEIDPEQATRKHHTPETFNRRAATRYN